MRGHDNFEQSQSQIQIRLAAVSTAHAEHKLRRTYVLAGQVRQPVGVNRRHVLTKGKGRGKLGSSWHTWLAWQSSSQQGWGPGTRKSIGGTLGKVGGVGAVADAGASAGAVVAARGTYRFRRRVGGRRGGGPGSRGGERQMSRRTLYYVGAWNGLRGTGVKEERERKRKKKKKRAEREGA